MSAIDEDETVVLEVWQGERHTLNVGIENAKAHARGDYLAGRIEADEFECEIDRLLRKEAAL